jgi:hypothetical protein
MVLNNTKYATEAKKAMWYPLKRFLFKMFYHLRYSNYLVPKMFP